jgi:hypothetical protein
MDTQLKRKIADRLLPLGANFMRLINCAAVQGETLA